MIKLIQEHIGDETTSMRQNTVSSEVNKKYVKHFGCSQETTNEINVRVGHWDMLSSNLCKECVKSSSISEV
jgi:hypothetical protein